MCVHVCVSVCVSVCERVSVCGCVPVSESSERCVSVLRDNDQIHSASVSP